MNKGKDSDNKTIKSVENVEETGKTLNNTLDTVEEKTAEPVEKVEKAEEIEATDDEKAEENDEKAEGTAENGEEAQDDDNEDDKETQDEVVGPKGELSDHVGFVPVTDKNRKTTTFGALKKLFTGSGEEPDDSGVQDRPQEIKVKVFKKDEKIVNSDDFDETCEVGEITGHNYTRQIKDAVDSSWDTEETKRGTQENSEETSNSRAARRKKRRYAIDAKRISMVILVCAMITAVAIITIQNSEPATVDKQYNEFTQMLDNGEVQEITLYNSGNTFDVLGTDGQHYKVPSPKYEDFRRDMMQTGVKVNVASQTKMDTIKALVSNLPILVLMGVLLYYLASSLGTMTKSYMQTATVQDGVKFTEVAGLSEVKEEVRFAVDFLKNTQEYAESGARVPKGMLLIGPPGTGKTLLAKAVAGEADVPFIHTSGSDFCEMFAGLGAKRVRELFEFAKTNAPCVVFIDEIDSVGARRSSNTDSVARDGNQTLNALLKEMDGIGSVLGVFVMAATNTPEHLDPALTRPGRFDRQVFIGPPNTKEDRKAIIDVHLNGKYVDETISLDKLSKMMIGFTGAEIEAVLNEAVILSLMKGKQGVIGVDDVDEAITKMVTKGMPKKVKRTTELERVAVHESGHALMMLLNGDKVHKITIVPSTSGVGGYTQTDLENREETNLRTEEQLIGDVSYMFGGLCAEEVVYGSHSSGCSNDLQKVKEVIVNMVTRYGMGGLFVDLTDYWPERTADKITEISNKVYAETKKKLTENREYLDILVKKLLERETITGIESLEAIKNI